MAAHFPTASDYFSWGYQALDESANFTVMVWIRAPTTDWTETYPVVWNFKWGTNLKLSANYSGLLAVDFGGGEPLLSNSSFRADSDGGDGLWHHITIRRTSTTSLQLIWDGTLENTDTTDASAYTDGSEWHIGSNAGSATTGFQGDICQLRIWTTNLTDGELAIEKASPTLVKTASCYASWPLTTGTDVDDETTNNRDLSINGTPTTSATNPTQGGGPGSPHVDLIYRAKSSA